MTTTKSVGRPPNPFDMAVLLGIDNVGYAKQEGDLSMKALSNLGRLTRTLATISMTDAERRNVDALVARLRRDICDQLDLDCKDLSTGIELSQYMAAAKR